MNLPTYPVGDTPVRASWGRQVIDYLRSITPSASTDILPERTSNGTTFNFLRKNKTTTTTSTTTQYKKPFDLADLGSTSFSIQANLATGGGVWRDAVKVASITPSGLDSSWASGTISAAQYVYLVLDHESESATLTMATSLPDGSMVTGELAEVFPLWYIAWDSTSSTIDTANIIDMRGSIHVTTMREHGVCVDGEPYNIIMLAGEPY